MNARLSYQLLRDCYRINYLEKMMTYRAVSYARSKEESSSAAARKPFQRFDRFPSRSGDGTKFAFRLRGCFLACFLPYIGGREDGRRAHSSISGGLSREGRKQHLPSH